MEGAALDWYERVRSKESFFEIIARLPCTFIWDDLVLGATYINVCMVI